jgi:type III restriction enzyme
VVQQRSVVSYDKDLPEVPDRLGQSHLPPTSYLRKKEGTDEFEVVRGRRPSKLLLVNRLREEVNGWRTEGYPGASDVTRRLFEYWFEEDHELDGKIFRYYFGQREALEMLAYLVEVKKIKDSKPLIDAFGEAFYPEGIQRGLPAGEITHQTTVDGRRRMRRYIPEVEGEVIQDLPPENLRRYSFKMATGSGKTVVMALVAVWSFFHKLKVSGSDLSTNFLIVAPNVIVYQRLEKDFASNRIFHAHLLYLQSGRRSGP